MTILYQFPQSHFCEKARWALDYKQVSYQPQTMLPGIHIIQTKRMGLGSTLPVLRHDGRLIQNSSDIITYLDNRFPQNPLTPTDPRLKQEALDWEAKLDEEIGPHLRRVFYHSILDDRELTAYFFSYNGPFYGRFFVSRAYPGLRHFMRQSMAINSAETAASRQKLQAIVDELQAIYNESLYLVGDSFTRADLTAAALLAALHQPPQYGIVWPELPAELETLINELVPQTTWLPRLYQDHRPTP